MTELKGKAKSNIESLNSFGSEQRQRNTIEKLSSYMNETGRNSYERANKISGLFNQYQDDEKRRKDFLNKTSNKLKKSNTEIQIRREQTKALDNFRINKLGNPKDESKSISLDDSLNKLKSYNSEEINSGYEIKDTTLSEDSKLLKKGDEFQRNLSTSLNKSYMQLRDSGYNDKEIAQFYEQQFKGEQNTAPKKKKLGEELKGLEKLLTEHSDGFLETLKETAQESYVQSTVMKMRSEEAMKAMHDQPNNLNQIDEWIEKHPEMYQTEKDNKFFNTISKGARGLADNSFEWINDASNSLKNNSSVTFATIGAIAGLTAFTVATGGLGGVVASPLIAGGATATGAVAGVGVPIIGTGLTVSATSAGLATAAGAFSGLGANVINERYKKNQVRLYEDYIKEGLDPTVASITSSGMSAVTSYMDYKRLGIAMNGMPKVKQKLDGYISQAGNETITKLAKLATGYGIEVASLAGDSTAQTYFENVAKRLSQNISQTNMTLPEAGITAIAHPILDENLNGEFYLEAFKQSANAMMFTPLISRVKRVPEILGEQKEKSDIDKRLLDSSKKFLEQENMDKLNSIMQSSKTPVNEKMAYNDMLLSFSNSLESVLSDKTNLFNLKDRKEYAKIKNRMDSYYDSEMASKVLANRNIEISKTGYSYIKNRLVDAIYNDKINPHKNMENFTNINKVVVENYKKAKDINGFVETVETLSARGYTRAEIASSSYKLLPRNKRNEFEASKLINAIFQVNDESKYQVSRDMQINNDNIVKSVIDSNKFTRNFEDKPLTTIKNENIDEQQKINNQIKKEKTKNVELTETETRVAELENARKEQKNKIDIQKDETKHLKVDKDKVNKYKNSDVYEIPIEDIKVDAKKFQFRLRGTDIDSRFGTETKYNKDLSGITHLYKDESGQLFVIDGHHRIGLAQRSGEETITAKIIDSKDMNIKEARIFGAKLNIAEENAGTLDVAKLIKNGDITKEDFKKYNIRTNSNIYKDGVALAEANQKLFDKVLIGRAEPELVAEISKNFPDKKEQLKVFDYIRDSNTNGKEITPENVKFLRGAIYDTDGTDSNWDFFSLMGEDKTVSLVNQKIDLINFLNKDIKDQKNLFKRITKKKNVDLLSDIADIDIESGKKNVTQRELIQNAFNMAYRHPQNSPTFHSLLKDYAQQIYDEPNRANVLYREFADKSVNLIESGKINYAGYDIELYNKIYSNKDFAHSAQENNYPDISMLYTDNYTGNRIFEFSRKFNGKLADKLNKDNETTVLIDKGSNKNKIKELMIPIDSISKNDYFKGIAFQLDKSIATETMTKEQLKNLGYNIDNLPKDVVVKGFYQFSKGKETSGVPRIVLSENADKSTVAEEVIHYILDKEKVNKTDLNKEIKDWTKESNKTLESIGQNKISGEELFIKSYLKDKLGYQIPGSEYIPVKMNKDLSTKIDNILGKDFIDTIFNDKVPKDFNYNKPTITKETVLKKGKDVTSVEIARSKLGVDTNKKSFKKWFKDSKVVDYKNEPLVVYGSEDVLNNTFRTYKDESSNNQEYYLNLKKVFKADTNSPVNYDELLSRGYDAVEYTKGDNQKEYKILGEKEDKIKSIYNDYDFDDKFKGFKESPTVDYQIDTDFYNYEKYETDDYKVRESFKKLKKRNPQLAELYADETSPLYKVKHDKQEHLNALLVIDKVGQEPLLANLKQKFAENSILNDSEHMQLASLLDLAYKQNNSIRAAEITILMSENAEKFARGLRSNMYMYMSPDGYGDLYQDRVFKHSLKGKTERIDNKYNNVYNKIKDINNDTVDNIIDYKKLEADTNAGVDSEALGKVIKDYYHNSNPKNLAIEFKDRLALPEAKAIEVADKVKKIVNDKTSDEKRKILDSLTTSSGKKRNKKNGFNYDEAIDNLSTNSFIDKNSKENKLFKGDLAETDGVSSLNSRNNKYITEEIARIKGMTDSKAQSEAVASLNRRVANEYTPTLGEKVSTGLVISRLMKGDLALRNSLGNLVLGKVDSHIQNTVGVVTDNLFKKFTGIETNTFVNPLEMYKIRKNSYVEAFKESSKSIWNDENVNTINKYNASVLNEDLSGESRLSKNALDKLESRTVGLDKQMSNIGFGDVEIDMSRPMNQTFKNPFMHTLEKITNLSLSASDSASYNSAFAESVERDIRMYDKKGVDITVDMAKNIIGDARNYASYATFTDNNFLTDASVKTRDVVNNVSWGLMKKYAGIEASGDFGLGNLSMPFAKTGANVASKAVDYSPFGYLSAIATTKNVYDNYQNWVNSGKTDTSMQRKTFVAQKEAGRKFARATAGTSFIFGGMLLAKSGMLSVNDYDSIDDSKKVKSFLTDKGYKPFALQFKSNDGTTHFFDYSWLDPISVSMSVGAMIEQEAKMNDGESTIGDKLTTIGKLFINKYSDVDTLSNVLTNLTQGDSLGDSAIEILGNTPNLFAPAIIKQVAMLADPTKKDVWDSNPFKRGVKQFASSIPGVRNMFDDKYTVFGDSITFYEDETKVATKFLDIFLNPAKHSSMKLDDTETKLMEIYGRTRDSKVIPGKMKNEFDGYELDKRDFNQISNYRGVMIKESLDNFMRDGYIDGDDDYNVYMINKIIDYVNTSVRDSVKFSLKEGGFYE